MYEAFTLFGGVFRLLPLTPNFLTLPVDDSRSVAIKTAHASINALYWSFVISQPLYNIRLSAYPRVNTRKIYKFWLFPFRSPLLWELRFLSLPVAT